MDDSGDVSNGSDISHGNNDDVMTVEWKGWWW
jgi:hypothetical protein